MGMLTYFKQLLRKRKASSSPNNSLKRTPAKKKLKASNRAVCNDNFEEYRGPKHKIQTFDAMQNAERAAAERSIRATKERSLKPPKVKYVYPEIDTAPSEPVEFPSDPLVDHGYKLELHVHLNPDHQVVHIIHPSLQPEPLRASIESVGGNSEYYAPSLEDYQSAQESLQRPKSAPELYEHSDSESIPHSPDFNRKCATCQNTFSTESFTVSTAPTEHWTPDLFGADPADLCIQCRGGTIAGKYSRASRKGK